MANSRSRSLQWLANSDSQADFASYVSYPPGSPFPRPSLHCLCATLLSTTESGAWRDAIVTVVRTALNRRILRLPVLAASAHRRAPLPAQCRWSAPPKRRGRSCRRKTTIERSSESSAVNENKTAAAQNDARTADCNRAATQLRLISMLLPNGQRLSRTYESLRKNRCFTIAISAGDHHR